MSGESNQKLPQNWVETTLADVRLDLSTSIDPRRFPNEKFELFSVPSYADGNPQVLLGKDIGSHKQCIQEDVVLLCKINPRINRVWVVKKHTNYKTLASTEWIPFFSVDGLSPNYLGYYLQKNEFRGFLASNASGVGGSLMRIKPATFAQYPFPLAPTAEQHRIVNKIEELFTKLDAGVEALKKLKAQLKRYRQAVLKAAVEGKLTEQWREEYPDVEPADKLVKRILAERRARWEAAELAKIRAKRKEPKNNRWKSRYKEPVVPSLGKLRRLPRTWTFVGIEQLLTFQKDAMKTGPFGSLLKKTEHRSEGVPVLGIENIERMRFVAGSKIHITEQKAEELEAYRVDPGDILISRSGTVGEVCVVPGNIGEARISTNLMKLTLIKDVIHPSFFTVLLNGSPFVLQQVSELCKGSTRNFLNQDILKRLVLVLPPMEEQIIIIEEVDRCFSLIAGIENEIEHCLMHTNLLRQSILRQAFSGGLVHQDPTDEPAEKLIERIKHVRKGRELSKRVKRKTKRKANPKQMRLIQDVE